MALGKSNQFPQGKAYSLKLQLKDGKSFLDCARFAIQDKVDGEYKDVGYETDISGNLFKIEMRQWEYEGKTNRSFKLGLRDSIKKPDGKTESEAYFVEVPLGSNLARGLANSILNLQAFDNVQIGLYSQTNRETKKVYPAVALRQGEAKDTVKWKYDSKMEGTLLPGPRIYEGPDGPAKDFKKQEIFLFERLTEFAKVVEAAQSKTKNAVREETSPTEAPEPVTPSEPDEEALPF